MPIQISPPLAAELADRITKLQDENTQLALAKTQKQGNIAGTVGPPPGLQKEEDVNVDLYNQLQTLIGLFESERRALDGVYPTPAVTPTDLENAAQNVRPSLLFPISNKTLDPTRIASLDGTGGSDPVNETAEKTAELAAIASLLLTPLAGRLASAFYTAWVASLTAQSTLLATQIAAATANTDFYGPTHPAVTAATSEKSAVDALLPAPAVDNATLTARQAQATTRQGTLASRVSTLVTDVTPFYDDRFRVIRSRINTAKGTLSILRGTEKTILLIDDFIALNNELLAYYTSVQ